MDTREWYNQPAYSDLTIKLSDGTELKVHRIILCQSNEYFRKLCGPDSHFAEANQKTIELKDDDAEALELVLRHIYRRSLEEIWHPSRSWRFWLNVHLAADKYLEPQFSKSAAHNFRRNALACSDADEIFDVIETINTEFNHVDALVEFSEELRKENLGKLLKNERFRALLDASGKEALRQQLDDLAFAADLVERKYALCETHARETFRDCDLETRTSCNTCMQDSYGPVKREIPRSAWVHKDDI